MLIELNNDNLMPLTYFLAKLNKNSKTLNCIK